MVKHPIGLVNKVAWLRVEDRRTSLCHGSPPFYQKIMGRCAEHFRMSVPLCEAADIKVTPRSLLLCTHGYIGSSFTAKVLIGKLPKPDFLVWWEQHLWNGSSIGMRFQARAFKVPLFFFDTSFIYDELYDHTLNYVQKDERIYLLSRDQLKRPFPEKRFQDICSVRMKQSLCGKRFLISSESSSPLGSVWCFIHMAPICHLRGTTWAVRYYRKLKKKWKNEWERGWVLSPVRKSGSSGI